MKASKFLFTLLKSLAATKDKLARFVASSNENREILHRSYLRLMVNCFTFSTVYTYE